MILSISIALFVLILIYNSNVWKYYYNMWKYGKEIPGPDGLFLLGNVKEVLLNGEEHFEFRRRLALEFPKLFKLRIINYLAVHIYSPDDVETVLTDMELLTKGLPYTLIHEWLGTGLLTSTGSQWQNKRKILTPAFHFSILQEFLEIFNRETDQLVDVIRKSINKPINVIKPITEFALSSIGETSLGIPINKEPNCDRYKEAIYFVGDFLGVRISRPWLNVPYFSKLFPSVHKNSSEIKMLHEFSLNVVNKRKQQILKDGNASYSMKKRLALLDLLLKMRYQENVNISDKDIREEVDTFMFEGHDTTAVSLCYTLQALANEQKIQEEIYQEICDVMGKTKKHPSSNDLSNMSFMERCIKESLRLYPSAAAIVRKATKNVKLKSGYVIPSGSDIGIMIYSMHRSPSLWNEPEKFDPDRFLPENIAGRHPFAYIPFSAGPRNCIGQKYAMLELKAALCGILRNFKLEPVTKPSDIRYKLDLVLRPVDEINVKFVERK